MPIKMTAEGDWVFDSVSDALVFSQGLRPDTQPKKRQRREAKHTTTEPSGITGLSDGSSHILTVLRAAPNDGLMSDDFAVAVGADSPTAVSVRMMKLGKELKALGYSTKSVVSRKRVYVKGRPKSVFKPGPKLTQVLSERKAREDTE